MTTHELARQLLKLPNKPAVVHIVTPGWYGECEREFFEVTEVIPIDTEYYNTEFTIIPKEKEHAFVVKAEANF